jgi:hypothetical protein
MPHRPKRERKRRRIRSFADLWRALEHRRERVDGRLFELVPATKEGSPVLIVEEIGSTSERSDSGRRADGQ